MNKMLNIAGRILSQLLNVPVISGLLLIYLYERLPEATPNRFIGFIYALGFISLIPLTSLFFYIPGNEKNREIVFRRQRIASFVLMAVSYPIGWIVLSIIQAPQIFQAMDCVYTFVTLGLIVFNLFAHYKASGHAAGVAGPAAAMTFLYGIWAAPLLLLLPLVGWARVKAKGHSIGQTVVGGIMSLLITVLVLAAFGFAPFQATIY